MKRYLLFDFTKSFDLRISCSALLIFIVLSCQKDDVPLKEYTKVIYVADEESGTISVIDAAESKKIASINLQDGENAFLAHNVQVAPNGKSVWVTAVPSGHNHDNKEQIIVIDPISIRIKKRISAGVGVHLAHVVLDSTSAYAYVTATESNEVLKIDASTFAIVSRIPLGTGHEPHGVRCFGENLFVANLNAKSLSIINTKSLQIEEIALGGIAVQSAVTPDGKFVFVSLYDTKEIAIYDPLLKKLTKIDLPLGSKGPIQLYPTPDSKFLYVCDQGGLNGDPISNKVYVIDISASAVINTITVGNRAHGIVIDNEGKFAFVTNSGDNSVSIIDISAQKVVNIIAVGKSPNGIGYRFLENGVTGGMP